jgi:uncharacterized membrane protein
MLFEVLATLSAGVFAGAAIYINLVEHPARIKCGTEVALKHFAPSYHRATLMQVPLAVIGFLMALVVWLRGGSVWWLIGGLILIVVIPFTLLVIFPTNKKILNHSPTNDSESASKLLLRWGRLHAVRTILSTVSFLIFLLIGRLPM